MLTFRCTKNEKYYPTIFESTHARRLSYKLSVVVQRSCCSDVPSRYYYTRSEGAPLQDEYKSLRAEAC